MCRTSSSRVLLPVLALLLSPLVSSAAEPATPDQPWLNFDLISGKYAEGASCEVPLAQETDRPQPTRACNCPPGVGSTVIHCWGFGSTCTAADTAFQNNCWDVASGECVDGACRIQIVAQSACLNCSDYPGMCPSGQKFFDGDAKFRCLFCTTGPCPDPPCEV